MPLQSCFPSKRNEVRSVGQILFFLCFSSIRAVCAPIYYWIGYSRFVGYSVVACMLLVTVSNIGHVSGYRSLCLSQQSLNLNT